MTKNTEADTKQEYSQSYKHFMLSKQCQAWSEKKKSSDVQHFREAVKSEEIGCQVTKHESSSQRLLLSSYSPHCSW